MATMATESSAGGHPLGVGNNNTPPSTANPSTNPSRQTSARQHLVMNNNNNTTADDHPFTTSATCPVASAVPTTAARDVRANSLAEPPSSSSSAAVAAAAAQQRSSHTPSSHNNNSSNNETISYSAERIIGNGSFGVVFQASVVESGEIVAIKKVLQDKRFKNRELQIMRQLVKDSHSNIVALKHCFYSQVSFCLFDCLFVVVIFWEGELSFV